ncbi:MAG: 4Fe-4S dicluster domain-containing protein [candidate division WOR-3 bacterium]
MEVLLDKNRIKNFIEVLLGYGRVFASWEKEIFSNRGSKTRRFVREIKDNFSDYYIPKVRTFDNFKSFVLPGRFKVAEYPSEKWIDIGEKGEKEVLLGIKACDLNSFYMIDKVFLEDSLFVDPFYKKRRESLILISSDCGDSLDSCFCNVLGFSPYPEKGFDINIVELKEFYLLEIGSKIGEEISKNLSLNQAGKKELRERDEKRRKVKDKLEKQNREFSKAFFYLESIAEQAFDSDSGWELGSACVSCGACTNVCPVCYCFTLFDRKGEKENNYKRFMVWDSCQFKGFSQMAGGLNPRFSHIDQFKNRYYHKFFRFYKKFGVYKCTGCGRCIDNCLGGIDMREVFLGALEGVKR